MKPVAQKMAVKEAKEEAKVVRAEAPSNPATKRKNKKKSAQCVQNRKEITTETTNGLFSLMIRS